MHNSHMRTQVGAGGRDNNGKLLAHARTKEAGRNTCCQMLIHQRTCMLMKDVPTYLQHWPVVEEDAGDTR